MTDVRPIVPVAGLTLVLLLAYPTFSAPEAVAQTTPSIAPTFEGGIQGRVLNDLGYPVGGAVVTAGGASGGEQTALTEPDGRYQLAVGPGTWSVSAGARGHKAANDTVVVSGVTPATKDFRLAPLGPVVRGTVRDAASGAGIANATLEAYQDHPCKGDVCPLASPMYYQMPLSTRTASDGRYAIAVEAGNLRLRAWADGHREGYQAQDVQGNTTLDFRLEPTPPKTAILTGRVTDAKTGAPLREAWVNAWPGPVYARDAPMEGSGASGSPGSAVAILPPEPCAPDADCPSPPCCWEGNSTMTDRDGRFRMNMYPGDYQFSVGANEYGQHQQQVILEAGRTTTVDVALQPIPGETVTVRGIVLDKATGKPLPGVYVNVEGQEWGHYNGTATREDGRFEFRTRPGWSLVWARADGGGYVIAQPAEATPPPGTSDSTVAPEPYPARVRGPEQSYYPWVQGRKLAEGQTLDLRVELQPKPAADVRIEGYVLNATSKKPLAGAQVNVRNEDTGDWGYAQTDKDGSFVILGRAGMHTLQAYAEDHFANAVVVQVKGPATRVDIPLEPGHSQGYCCIAYAEGMAVRGAAPPASPTAGGGAMGAPAGDDGAAQVGNVTGAGPATYRTSGGLGPYNPATAPTPGAPQVRDDARATPGPATVLAGLALAGTALALARRRR